MTLTVKGAVKVVSFIVVYGIPFVVSAALIPIIFGYIIKLYISSQGIIFSNRIRIVYKTCKLFCGRYLIGVCFGTVSALVAVRRNTRPDAVLPNLCALKDAENRGFAVNGFPCACIIKLRHSVKRTCTRNSRKLYNNRLNSGA